MISQFWVGQIPMNNLIIGVLAPNGREADCSNYWDIKVRLLGSDNEEIDLRGSYLDTTGKQWGRFVFEWPRDRSLFTKPGDYVLQLILESIETVWVYDGPGGIVPPKGIMGISYDPNGGQSTGHYEDRIIRDMTTEHTLRVKEMGGKR